MATSAEYAAFVCDRVAEYGTARSRKMFGEYMVYLRKKPILLLCDNAVFVKKYPHFFGVAGSGMRYSVSRS